MFKTVISSARRMLVNSNNIRSVQLTPDFTQNIYKINRGNFNILEDHHVGFFENLLGKERVLNEENDLQRYNVDWYLQVRGNGKIVLRPKTTEEVSQILAFCNANRLAVCPQGGNTCVSGASVPVFDEIILSTELMNKIIKVDENSSVLVCQAGCVVETLNDHLAESNLILPLDLGSKGSCQIGGNVSTNAGGLRFFRYGSLHGNVLGLEVVTANGEVLDCLSTLKKDNTGYHLHHLFIGSEGTLGVVTKVAIQCPTQSKAISLAFLGVDSYENAIKTFKKAKTELSEIISAVEVVDTPSMDCIRERLNLSSPIGEHPFYLFVETKGSNEEHDQKKLHKFLESTISQKLIVNGTVTTEPTKYQVQIRLCLLMNRMKL
ncbi:hypothetical protein FQA39_LY05158 [Lamprigera yunnana]|nr:hypothetical protein FQA39_LY05158 [Lamprigera yunnana]